MLESPATEKLLTAEEFRLLPRDGHRLELVRGKVIEMPPTGYAHGKVCWHIAGLLWVYLCDRELGSATCNDSGVITRVDPDSVRGPDVAYFSYLRVPKGSSPSRYPDATPELVFEVKSPSDRWKAIHAKAGEYLAAGTLVVCVVDPETKEITVYNDTAPPAKKTIDDELTLPEVFPDFRVPLRRFFE